MTGKSRVSLTTGYTCVAAAIVLIAATAATLPAQEALPPTGASQAYSVSYTATFSPDQLVFGKLLGYDTVSLDDAACLNVPGQPMLPAPTLRIAVPADMLVTDVRVVATQSVEIAGSYSLYPAQPPRRVSDGGLDVEFIEPDPQVYESPAAYPAELVEFSRQTDLAGQGVALVRVHPLQCTPAKNTLTLHTAIELELIGTGGYVCGDYLPENASPRCLASYERLLADMVVNPEAVALRTTDIPVIPSRGVAAGDYDYVIITSTSWVDDFQPLADWKTKKGTPATIVTTDWIYNSGGYSGTNTQKIRSFVQDAHSTWGAIYFLLGGDTDTIPCDVRSFPTVDSETVPNDTYYADYDVDWTCEVHVGRASVRNTTAISTFNNKVFTYEQDPPLTNYAKTIAFFGFDLDNYTDGEDTKIDIDNLYVPSGWDFSSEYDSESGGHKTDVIAYMNEGNHLQNLIDHCNEYVMGVGYTNHNTSLSTTDIDNLYNGDRQCIFYTLGCWPCAFDYSACIAEHLVRDTNGGGMAFVGNTRYGWYYQGYDDYLSARFDRYFFRSLFSQGHYILGECFSDHKNDSYESEDVYQYIFTELTLLGDPELPIWTENPVSLAVSHAATLNAGQYTTFPVTVTSGGSPVNTATVCLWKDGDVYEVAQTNASGIASFGFTPASNGTMYVTATKHNYLPEESSATVIAGTTYTLTVYISGSGSVTLDPSGGVYAPNTPVELTANANTGWVFDHWTGNLTGSDNPDTIVMDDDKAVTAVFVTITDCNGNGVDDSEDIANGTSEDCNGNGVPDECDIWDLTSDDCNANGVPDECEEDSREGLAGAYYDDSGFAGTLRGRVDATIDFDWGNGEPWAGYGADTFSIRWTGLVQTPAVSGTYTFYTTTDDGVRLWVANQLIIDKWIDQAPAEWSGTIQLDANSEYPIVMEYYENGGGAVAELRWQPPGQSKVIIPASNLIAGRDCNTNGVLDVCDLDSGYSDDVNGNGIPDECDPQFTLTVNTSGQGSVTLDPPGGTYLEGTEVELTANADTGWSFDHWEGDLTGSNNPDTIVMDGDKSVTAVFTQNGYTLTVYVTGSGSVTKDPDQATYTYGQSVELTANADPGWSFDHWEGDLAGSNNPDTIVIDGNMTVTAVFTQNGYTLTVNVTGSGSVTKDPDQATYTYGQSVELTANADTGWSFDHWEGDLAGSDNPDSIVIDGNMTVTAVFTQNGYTLTVNVTGSGSVTKDPDQATYTYGQSIELTANADTGWSFDHWEGDLAGSDNPDAIVIDGNMTVTAVFTQNGYTLTVNVTGSGSVSKDPDQATYTYGQSVELTANADPGWSFDHWEGDLAGSDNPDTIVMDGDKSVTAVFVEDCYGDLNDDGRVDISDLATLLSNYGMVGGATYEQGDLTGDGNIDISDLAELLSVYGTICW